MPILLKDNVMRVSRFSSIGMQLYNNSVMPSPMTALHLAGESILLYSGKRTARFILQSQATR
jgi:hypothetical protein